MILLVSGTREFTDYELFVKIFESILEQHSISPSFIIQGCAEGIDKFAMRWASENGIPSSEDNFEALWDLQGGRAGRIRNKKMADEEFDFAIVIRRRTSTGSRHMLSLVMDKGIPYHDIIID